MNSPPSPSPLTVARTGWDSNERPSLLSITEQGDAENQTLDCAINQTLFCGWDIYGRRIAVAGGVFPAICNAMAGCDPAGQYVLLPNLAGADIRLRLDRLRRL